jgi:hypothetical protein
MSIFNRMSLSEVYERFLVEPLFRPFAEEVLNRLHPTPDDSMLDVACGTGIVARCARRRLGPQALIVGVDAAPPIWPLRDGPIRRSTGAMATRWRCRFRRGNSLQSSPVIRGCSSSRTNRLRFARCAVCWLAAGVGLRHSFGDGRAFSPLLSEAGFRDIQVEMVSVAVRGIDGPTYARLNARAIVGMSPKAKTLGDAERAELIERVETDSWPVVDTFTRSGVFEFNLATNVATARA